MIRNKPLRNMNNLIQSLSAHPLTFKKAVLLCCYAEGVLFAANRLFSLFNLNYGILPDILYLAAVLTVVREMGKDELRRILAWRDIPLGVFAGVMVMFYGFNIIRSELHNLLEIVLPSGDFFDGWFYEPESLFMIILTGSLFPGFTEEIFFRGIIARRFFRAYPLRKAILLSAVLFGLCHLNPWQAVNSFFGGIFYAWIYWRYKSIWLCMFLHAYNNALVSLMTVPYVEMQNEYYEVTWRHPVWFDVLGVLLFAFGLLTVIVLSREKEEKGVKKG
jgi:membrane protease YdiL (CAAX protease family)